MPARQKCTHLPRHLENIRQRKIFDDKGVQFYSACINAYYSTSFEHDRSILTLSAAGIGLIIGLVVSEKAPNGPVLNLAIIAMLCFTLSLAFILAIFKCNRKHILDIVHGDSTESSLLNRLDNFALVSFALGIIFSVIVGISVSTGYFSGSSKMSDKLGKTIAQDSISGISNARPVGIVEKSVSGVAALKPQPQQSIPAQSTQNSTSAGDKK